MRINIASYGGRNWLLDLAKELDSHGHEVKFYSYLTTKRAVKFGLKKECNSSYFVLALPFLFLSWVFQYSLKASTSFLKLVFLAFEFFKI